MSKRDRGRERERERKNERDHQLFFFANVSFPGKKYPEINMIFKYLTSNRRLLNIILFALAQPTFRKISNGSSIDIF